MTDRHPDSSRARRGARPAAALLVGLALLPAAPASAALEPQALERGIDEPVAKVNEHIYQATGFGNTFLVLTKEGNAVIDTSNAAHAPRHREILGEVSKAPVRYIFLTHGHGDHTGGVDRWQAEDTKVVAQANYVEFLNYQWRLQGFFSARNAAQMARPVQHMPVNPGNYAAPIKPNILVEDRAEFRLGELTFICLATPGETYDHMTVWIPELKAAFVGDNYYESFPNIYTLRGTKARYALDYVESLETVLDLEPELVLPSHGKPIIGAEAVKAKLGKYRDAILYVHDATVKGMNEGKDVYTLMREIKLPEALEVGEGYGAVAWSVRGIYEGYAGWFDTNPATMYAVAPAEVHKEVALLAGGAAIAARAQALLADGKPELALKLTDVALAGEPTNRAALEARLAALEVLYERAQNTIETGWLTYGLNQTKAALGIKE